MVGSTLAHYRITAPLGAGGMGEVYRATDTKLGRDVAVKVLPADVAGDADRLARLEREARAVAALSHPNILSVYELGRHDGTAYVVTELLEGETLRERLDGGPLPRAQGGRIRRAGGAGSRRRARQGDRPPGPQAREPVRDRTTGG